MVSPFGKYLRKIRIDIGITLQEMADKLKVSSAQLSFIETGKRNISSNFIEKVIKFLKLTKRESEQLYNLVEQSQKSIKIPLDNISYEYREVVSIFSKKFSHLTINQINKIKKVLKD